MTRRARYRAADVAKLEEDYEMGISIWQLLIVLLIVVLLFGTKKLSSIGKDMGGAVKGFRDSMRDGEQDAHSEVEHGEVEHKEAGRVIEGQVSAKEKDHT